MVGEKFKEIHNVLSSIDTRWIAGVDEAGRGAWAGPLSVAMVIRSRKKILSDITGNPQRYFSFRDSKKLSQKNRERIYPKIKKSSPWSLCVLSSPEEIEKFNINGATEQALRKIVKRIPEKIKKDVTILMDGRFKFNVGVPYLYLIKGDTLLCAIGDASILAKVYRDRLMCRLDKRISGYGFSKHKGYGTKLHREMLLKLGVSKIHRRKYRPIAELL